MTRESDISVVRSPRWLWFIDVIMIKLAKTNFISWGVTENVLEDPKVAVDTL